MNPLLDNFSKEKKNLKLFKQLIKLESKALKQFLNETILLSKQYNSSLFDGIHYSLSKFQSDLQNQYIQLKQLGKQFYKLKQDIISSYIQKKAQTCFKNKLSFENKEFDETDIDNQNETKKQQDYSIIQIDDIIRKEKCLIKKTNQIIQIFTEKHNLTLYNMQKLNNQEFTGFSDQKNVYMKSNSKATILSSQTIESITIDSLDENESILVIDFSFEKQLQKERQLDQFLNDQQKKKLF
ncbi:unnamed protein product [Paramecium primaurelia]|uniref:Uncharacterized protein n=1 Tax=Paramecium primaurelia TaxID=5886 RepID=A0A8S1M7V4_PARPR|nr:unnamed protein product [Paramecium primaurelia]